VEMSCLSAQMAALEKKLAQGGEGKPSTEIHARVMEEPTALFVSDEMDSSCLRAPPPSLKSDSDLERYFRANVETKCENAVMMPATEPIRNESDSSAIQREYDLDTWKMYHRIQSSRKHVVEGTFSSFTAQVVSDQRKLSVCSETEGDVSFHEENDDEEGIFELELDS